MRFGGNDGIARLAIAAMLGGVLLHMSPVAAQAQSWTGEEREQLLEALQGSAGDFLAGIEGLSDGQWVFQEADDRWSIGQVAEHLALSEEFIGALVLGIGSSEKVDTWRDGRAEVDVMIRDGLKDRSQRFQAPEQVAPQGEPRSEAELAALFTSWRERVTEFVKTTDVDLRAHMAPHPAFGEIDGHQWVLLITSHVWRHLDQIAEVKANDGFPGR